jgi:hypothetical protein
MYLSGGFAAALGFFIIRKLCLFCPLKPHCKPILNQQRYPQK